MITSTPIDFWFSIASTYTYLSVTRMAEVVRRSGADVRWRPFEVRSIMIEQNNIPFRTKPVKLAYMWRDLERRAALHGVAFAGAAPYPLRDVVLADSVALIGAQEGWCAAYVPAIYRRWFIGQRDVSDGSDIAIALEEAGQEPARVLALASTDATKHALTEATNQAKALGVFGSPTFVVGSEVFWGDDRLEDAIAWSRKGALRD
jgi:2-hydroxychromene-2-carboxylate isomerase